jgi:hypothetical protein
MAMDAIAGLVLCLPAHNCHIPLQTVRLPEGLSQYLHFYPHEYRITYPKLPSDDST